MLRVRKGQTVAEYAILLSLVIAAAVAMQVYVKRGLQARIKKGTDAFTGITETIDSGSTETGGTSKATFDKLDQYEPYYQESSYNRYQENIEQEKMGGGKIVKEKISDVTAAAAGGYEQQATADNRATRDAKWTASVTP